MAVYRYPQEVHDFVKKWSPKRRDQDLAKACNEELGTSFTAQSMKAFRGNHGYRNGKKQRTKEEYWKYQTRYPQGMYEFIRDNSWNVSSKDMAEMVNLCCNKGYDIQIKFKNYKTYRINDYVKRFVSMDDNLLTEFRQNNSYLFGDNESLILWLNKVIETINKDKRESEIPKRRKK